jgi:hypothetical protein
MEMFVKQLNVAKYKIPGWNAIIKINEKDRAY